MKKFIYLILVMFLIAFMLPLTISASDDNIINDESNEVFDESKIIKFNYYPSGTLSKERALTFEWISKSKMEDLSILVYNPNLNKYIEVFNMSWDLTDLENTFDVEFQIINEPIDDPLTPDIDETLNQLWEYKLTFVLAKDTYGLLKFKFIYTCDEIQYDNLFYLPNVVYPSVVVPPTNEKDDDQDNDNENDSYFTTSNALIAAIFATIFSVIGTLLIIFSSQYKKSSDEVLK